MGRDGGAGVELARAAAAGVCWPGWMCVATGAPSTDRRVCTAPSAPPAASHRRGARARGRGRRRGVSPEAAPAAALGRLLHGPALLLPAAGCDRAVVSGRRGRRRREAATPRERRERRRRRRRRHSPRRWSAGASCLLLLLLLPRASPGCRGPSCGPGPPGGGPVRSGGSCGHGGPPGSHPGVRRWQGGRKMRL